MNKLRNIFFFKKCFQANIRKTKPRLIIYQSFKFHIATTKVLVIRKYVNSIQRRPFKEKKKKKLSSTLNWFLNEYLCYLLLFWMLLSLSRVHKLNYSEFRWLQDSAWRCETITCKKKRRRKKRESCKMLCDYWRHLIKLIYLCMKDGGTPTKLVFKMQ